MHRRRDVSRVRHNIQDATEADFRSIKTCRTWGLLKQLTFHLVAIEAKEQNMKAMWTIAVGIVLALIAGTAVAQKVRIAMITDDISVEVPRGWQTGDKTGDSLEIYV